MKDIYEKSSSIQTNQDPAIYSYNREEDAWECVLTREPLSDSANGVKIDTLCYYTNLNIARVHYTSPESDGWTRVDLQKQTPLNNPPTGFECLKEQMMSYFAILRYISLDDPPSQTASPSLHHLSV